MKNKRRQKTIQLAVWTWIWVASLALASIGSRLLWENSDLLNLLSITINIVLGVMMIIANRNMFNTYDELERKIQLESMAFTLGLTVVVGLAYSLLEQTKIINQHAEISFLVLFLGVTLMISLYFNRRRYQ